MAVSDVALTDLKQPLRVGQPAYFQKCPQHPHWGSVGGDDQRHPLATGFPCKLNRKGWPVLSPRPHGQISRFPDKGSPTQTGDVHFVKAMAAAIVAVKTDTGSWAGVYGIRLGQLPLATDRGVDGDKQAAVEPSCSQETEYSAFFNSQNRDRDYAILHLTISPSGSPQPIQNRQALMRHSTGKGDPTDWLHSRAARCCQLPTTCLACSREIPPFLLPPPPPVRGRKAEGGSQRSLFKIERLWWGF